LTIEARLGELCGDFAGVAGVAAENLATGERVELRADETFPTASAIKIFVLFTLFSRAASGALDLGERRTLSREARTLGSGVLLHLSEGLAPTRSDLATLMSCSARSSSRPTWPISG